MATSNQEKLVRTTCSSHCGGTCPFIVHVKDGRITRIETDDGAEPQFRACLRGRAYRQRVYAPDRLLYPRKRVGERGEGKFQRIAWDEALDTVAKEITRVRQTYGPKAMLYVASGGDITWLHGSDLTANLLARTGGYTATWGFQSQGACIYALMSTYGTPYTSSGPDDMVNSKLIIMWGWNPTDTVIETNTSWHVMQAKEAGARIVSVDPKYTASTALYANQWIPVKPGTDSAVLVAMAYVMITEKLYNRAFVDKYTVGFDRYKDYVIGKEDGVAKTPAWAEAISGVKAEVISKLARDYATMRPAALIDGMAPGRSAYGEQFHRAAYALVAMTGNLGIHGGNAGYMTKSGPVGTYNRALLGMRAAQRMKGGANPIDAGDPPRKYNLPVYEKYLKGWSSPNRVHRNFIADAILKGKAGGYPSDYKLLYTINANYVNQYPNSNKVVKALKALEFIVVQEQFMTATAKYADILLPNNTFLERNDVTVGGATPFFGYMNKAIDSQGESKSQFEIASALAARLGLKDFSDKTEEEWLREIIKDVHDIPDYETFKREGIHKVHLPGRISFEKEIKDPEHNPFPTPSGKIEIFSAQLAGMNNPLIPPIPRYIESWESPNHPLAKKYPLQLVTSHFKRRAHTQYDNIPWLRELEAQAVAINTLDAQKRGIKDGDMVRVFNDRGVMMIPARVTERIMPGVVDVPQGAWYDPDENGVDRGGCANVLTRDEITQGGGLPTNTCLVQVEKARK